MIFISFIIKYNIVGCVSEEQLLANITALRTEISSNLNIQLIIISAAILVILLLALMYFSFLKHHNKCFLKKF